MDVATGFATHAGWSVAVTAGLVGGHLRICDRRRVELVSSELPRQAYHAASDLPIGEARKLVATIDSSIAGHSSEALTTIRRTVSDHVLVALGIVGRELVIPDVDRVLASHPLMHAAEGEQYRRGLAQAAARFDLPVRRIDPKRLAAEMAELVGWSPSRLTAEHAQVRAAIGPPWQKDHKEAAAAALIALHAIASALPHRTE